MWTGLVQYKLLPLGVTSTSPRHFSAAWEGERQRQESEQVLSSLVWICTSTHSVSRVTVIDANNPADILESFNVCQSYLLCIASVPGALPSDYLSTEEPDNRSVEVPVTPVNPEQPDTVEGDGEEKGEPAEPKIGQITFVSCATGSEDANSLPPVNSNNSPHLSQDNINSDPVTPQHQLMNDLKDGYLKDGLAPTFIEESDVSPTPSRRLLKDLKEGILKDGIANSPKENGLANEELEKMSSVLPTVWLGSQNGSVFVHSAVSQWRRCLHSIKLKDSVLSIVSGISSFIPRDPLMTRNPTNSHIVDSGKGRNNLIVIPDKFGFQHTRVQHHQCCLTIHGNIDRLAPISQTKILTSTLHDGCDLRLKNCRIRTHRDHQLPVWSHPHKSSACAAFCFRAVCKPFCWWKRFPSLRPIVPRRYHNLKGFVKGKLLWHLIRDHVQNILLNQDANLTVPTAAAQPESRLLKIVGTPPGHSPNNNVQGGEVETTV
ncbi:C-Jun-amino-terminal kinase-interacting protein [Homalodisca vitripennis]|nr:C-Jun-amino-terminal kinase-interacting protein [Homalodisca vitripennis]